MYGECVRVQAERKSGKVGLLKEDSICRDVAVLATGWKLCRLELRSLVVGALLKRQARSCEDGNGPFDRSVEDYATQCEGSFYVA